LLWQCRAKKPLIVESPNQELLSKQKADTVVRQVLSNNFEFVDLKAKVKTKFRSREKQNITLGTFVKIIKDSVIHATISKATFPVVIAIITPDSLKFINKIDQKYFVGDFNFIQEILKTEIDFYEIQDLLVGNPVKLKQTDSHYLIEEENQVFLSSKSKSALQKLKQSREPGAEWLVKYWVNELYKTGRTLVENDSAQENQVFLSSKSKSALQKLKQSREPGAEWLVKYWVNELYKTGRTLVENDSAQTSIEIIQADYNKVDGQLFPNRTQAQIVTPKDSISIQLNYQRVKINSGVDFEFSIPDHYKSY